MDRCVQNCRRWLNQRRPAEKSSRHGKKEISAVEDSSIGASATGNPEVRHDGVVLSYVAPGGPADQAGLKPGDVVLAIGDRFLFTANELNDEIRRYKPGSRVAFRYRRYSTIYDGNLTIGKAAARP
jgi:S1-C subfamily serine protease